MIRRHALRGLVVGAGLSILMAAATWFVYRPWALTWGATDAEIARSLPGDEIVAAPRFAATRAVTIAAAPAEVWPWIVQMGYRKAGFYSHDRLDNDGVPSADSIIPAYQDLKEGDLLPLSATADARVLLLEKARVLLLLVDGPEAHGAAWTWLFHLSPTDEGSTRLLTRLRADTPGVRTRLVLDLLEIVMMRKCMLGLKERAERTARAAVDGTAF